MHSRFVLISILFGCLAVVSSQFFCSDLLKRNRTKFYPLRHCQRSNKTRIVARNVENLSKCIQLAERNQALAFNFGHGKRPRKKGDSANDLLNLFDVQRQKEENKNKNITKVEKDLKKLEENADPYFNCEVLSCPEVGNMSTLINDTRFDYYTLYGNAPGNATCFPYVGLFMYYYDERMNYSEAVSTCESHRGYLAKITNDERTNFLSFLIQQQVSDPTKVAVIPQSTLNESINLPLKVHIRHAFIGLKETERKSNFVDSLNIPLQCYRFRAWAPKYPSEENRLGCVALTASKSWKMFDCRKRTPFICELKPTKPRRSNRRKFNRRCSLKRPNN